MQIFHLALASDWEAAQDDGAYRVSTRGMTLDDVGFIHAAHRHQLGGVANRFYGDVTEPILVLTIDTDRVTAAVVEEVPPGASEAFPHVYGELPVDAVIATSPAHIRNGILRVEGAV